MSVYTTYCRMGSQATQRLLIYTDRLVMCCVLGFDPLSPYVPSVGASCVTVVLWYNLPKISITSVSMLLNTLPGMVKNIMN